MLAQNFKSAAELEITEPQKEALMKTLVLLETGKLVHTTIEPVCYHELDLDREFSGHFNMRTWRLPRSCGTIACIGGTAQLIGDVSFGDWSVDGNDPLIDLFGPSDVRWDAITVAQAATALRSYLTIGRANWREALA